jgi:crossover junction endodeoxyribonuclease RuvC
MKRTMGIDPGAGGALALLDGDRLIHAADMPTIMVKGRAKVMPSGVVDLVVNWKPDQIVLEDVAAMPGQGVTSMFSFGRGVGILEGVIAALGYPLVMVRPATWKRAAGVPADKDAARLMATRLWPDHANLFARKKDDGRAEAALLARWMVTP